MVDSRELAERTEQLREAEESFRQLFQAVPAPLLLVGAEDTVVRSCNERATVLLDAPAEEIVGKVALELFEDELDGRRLWERLAVESCVEGFAVRVKTPGGRSFWTLVTARTLVVGREQTILASFTDLTDQKRTEETLRELARKDALTAVLNRRAFIEIADDEVTRVRRYGRSLCIAMVDLDHFASINDRFGHRTGDEALTLVAKTLTEQLRRPDRIGRYSGEKFAILLPETHLEDAREVAERSRLAVEALHLYDNGELVPLTMSAGVVEWQPGEPLGETLKRADAAVSDAKASGRNVVVCKA